MNVLNSRDPAIIMTFKYHYESFTIDHNYGHTIIESKVLQLINSSWQFFFGQTQLIDNE